MQTDEHARLDLLQGLVEILGRERAETLMGYLPATRELATRHDLRALDERLSGRIDALDERIEHMNESLSEQIRSVNENLSEQIRLVNESLTHQLENRYDSLTHQLENRYDSLTHQLENRYDSLTHQIEGGDQATRAALRDEMNRLITSQTRTIVFALVGAITANASLVLLIR